MITADHAAIPIRGGDHDHSREYVPI